MVFVLDQRVPVDYPSPIPYPSVHWVDDKTCLGRVERMVLLSVKDKEISQKTVKLLSTDLSIWTKKVGGYFGTNRVCREYP